MVFFRILYDKNIRNRLLKKELYEELYEILWI